MIFKQNWKFVVCGYWILCLFLIIAVVLRIFKLFMWDTLSISSLLSKLYHPQRQSFGTKGLFSNSISTQKQLTTLPNPNYISRKPVQNTFYNCFTLFLLKKKKKYIVYANRTLVYILHRRFSYRNAWKASIWCLHYIDLS